MSARLSIAILPLLLVVHAALAQPLPPSPAGGRGSNPFLEGASAVVPPVSSVDPARQPPPPPPAADPTGGSEWAGDPIVTEIIGDEAELRIPRVKGTVTRRVKTGGHVQLGGQSYYVVVADGAVKLFVGPKAKVPEIVLSVSNKEREQGATPAQGQLPTDVVYVGAIPFSPSSKGLATMGGAGGLGVSTINSATNPPVVPH